MRRLTLVLALLAAACAVLLAPAGAAAAKRKKSKNPAVTSVSPMRVKAGKNLSIRGRNFSRNRRRNTVIFAVGRRSIFAKPSRASSRRLVVKVPVTLERLMHVRDNALTPTRFTLKVATGRRFSRKTSRRLSPVVVPLSSARISVPDAPSAPSGGGGGGGTPFVPSNDCDNDGTPNSSDTSSDSDLIADSLERTLGTDPCKADTDGDGVEDGFEYRSAVDLNNDEYQNPNNSLPYPGKRPYPNPLDPSDGSTDYDGDSLSQRVEQKLWKFSTTPATRTLSPLTYSDGLQHSIYEFHSGQGDRRFPALAASADTKHANFVSWASANGYRNVFIDVHNGAKPAGTYGLFDANLDGSEASAETSYYDRDGSGYLSDDERDEDADGLVNSDENSRRLQPGWWKSCYGDEHPYYVSYAGTDPFDADSDGDGVRDGADDQDHDDVPNVIELSRVRASGLDDRENGAECRLSKAVKALLDAQEDPPKYNHPDAYGQVNPFNPCLPDTSSRTCSRYVGFSTAWAPFDNSPDWLSLN